MKARIRPLAPCALVWNYPDTEPGFAALADAPGHAGADYAIVEDFLNGVHAMLQGGVEPRWPLCDIRHSMEAYRIAFLENDPTDDMR